MAKYGLVEENNYKESQGNLGGLGKKWEIWHMLQHE